MKITLNWLKEYVDFDWSPEELAHRLTMLGLEVEGMQKLEGEFQGVVVAQVITREKHPNADKLSLCRVNDGRGERQIVCGADNFKAGDKVPLILPGHTLPSQPGQPPLTIKVGRIRGVESQGMLCSPDELGFPGSKEGLLILASDAKIGQPFAEFLGRPRSDVVYDLEITPNRPDWNSAIGIAREISALTGNPLRVPEVQIAPPPIAGQPIDQPAGSRQHGGRDGSPSRPFLEPIDQSAGSSRGKEADSYESQIALEPIEQFVGVRIEDPDLCRRYNARLIRGVKIGPSPDWMRSLLEKVGLRSINNVVDATNYVMLEVGQPLHAFDYGLLAVSSGTPTGEGGVPPPPSLDDPLPAAASPPSSAIHHPPSTIHHPPSIIIRRAGEGEKFVTLDGKTHTLTERMLLIADPTKPLALAGIMGGQNSEINPNTTDVLLESACFKPQNIRATSKKLDLRTDSSYRFERGSDIGICDWASRRAAQLILQSAGGRILDGALEAYPAPAAPKHIALRHAKTSELLGVDIPAESQDHFLKRLALEQVETGAGRTVFRIPTFRVDLKVEADLIEEVARLYGVDKIPATPPRGAIGVNSFDPVHDEMAEARRILTGLGLHEVQGQTLIPGCNEGQGRTLIPGPSAKMATGASGPQIATLRNPLSNDMNALRPTLLPGLLDTLRHNVSHKNNDLAFFEIGRVFSQVDGNFTEERRLAIALTGNRWPTFWDGAERDAKFDLFDLKGALEEFFEVFGLRGVTWARREGAALAQSGSGVSPLLSVTSSREGAVPPAPIPGEFFLESAAIELGKLSLGEMGQLSPALARQYDLRDAVVLAELNFDQLLSRRTPVKSFQPLSQFPSVRRDVAMLVADDTTHQAVQNLIKQARPANLEKAQLFDIFRGKNIPPGQKSMAYALTYRHPERTLTDQEVNAAHERLLEQFKQSLHAIIREA